jgi:hypothetical protein
MTEIKKRRIRRTAALLHWIGQMLLLIFITGLVIEGVFHQAASKLYVSETFGRASGAVMDAFNAFDRRRIEALTTFTPPTDAVGRKQWAADVETHMGQPVAAFVTDGGEVKWISKPPVFAAAIEPAEAVLSRPLRGDTLGSMFVLHRPVAADTTLYHLAVTGPLEGTQRWGVVYDLWDGWKAFLTILDRAKNADELEPAAKVVRQMIQLSPAQKGVTTRTGLRGFVRDKLVYATPGVDTTAETWANHFPGARVEYYLSGEESVFATGLGGGMPWGRLFAMVFLSAVLVLNYLWVRKLTRD